jgi:hypothetical protein
MLQIAELLVEMARQQERRVVEFALGNLERPFAEPAIDRRNLPVIMLSDALFGIFPAPTGACCTGAQPKRALAK